MAVKEILQLGNPKLYEKSAEITKDELEEIKPIIDDLHDTLMDFRDKYNAGRAIAAPQIGVMKRLIYMHIGTPVILINPLLFDKSEEMIEVWDDCMCFPDLMVKVRRHKKCRIEYLDPGWKKSDLLLGGDMSELLQHECDHLDGILAVSRAIDGHSFALRGQKEFLK
jgi:peptide deformylase